MVRKEGIVARIRLRPSVYYQYIGDSIQIFWMQVLELILSGQNLD